MQQNVKYLISKSTWSIIFLDNEDIILYNNKKANIVVWVFNLFCLDHIFLTKRKIIWMLIPWKPYIFHKNFDKITHFWQWIMYILNTKINTLFFHFIYRDRRHGFHFFCRKEKKSWMLLIKKFCLIIQVYNCVVMLMVSLPLQTVFLFYAKYRNQMKQHTLSYFCILIITPGVKNAWSKMQFLL